MAFVNERFSSPIGDFVIYTKIKRWYEYDRNKVFVPYRGFCYLYNFENKHMIFIVCFRPLSGILLFIQNTSKQGGKKHEVFVPYRGFCYLYQKQKFIANSNRLFSSPIGDFVIYTRGPYINTFGNIGFRPLSGILLFIQ